MPAIIPSSRGGEKPGAEFRIPSLSCGRLSRQFFDQSDRTWFCFGRMGREENTFRPTERRTSFVVLHVQSGALFYQELDNVIGTTIGRPHHSSDTHRIHVIDAEPQLVTKLHRFE